MEEKEIMVLICGNCGSLLHTGYSTVAWGQTAPCENCGAFGIPGTHSEKVTQEKFDELLWKTKHFSGNSNANN